MLVVFKVKLIVVAELPAAKTQSERAGRGGERGGGGGRGGLPCLHRPHRAHGFRETCVLGLPKDPGGAMEPPEKYRTQPGWIPLGSQKDRGNWEAGVPGSPP